MSESKIIYPEKFKEKVFNNLRHAVGDVRLLMTAIENNRDNVVRYMIEQTLEDSKLYVLDELKKDTTKRVSEDKINTYKIREEIYNEYMELLMLTDKQDDRSKLFR